MPLRIEAWSCISIQAGKKYIAISENGFGIRMAEWEKEKLRQREDATAKLKQSLADRPDISQIFVAYDGCGDSGCFEDHEYLDSEGKSVCADFLNDEVDEYVCSILPSGWEIDGSIRPKHWMMKGSRLEVDAEAGA